MVTPTKTLTKGRLHLKLVFVVFNSFICFHFHFNVMLLLYCNSSICQVTVNIQNIMKTLVGLLHSVHINNYSLNRSSIRFIFPV